MNYIQYLIVCLSFQIIQAQTNQEVLSLITESKIYFERKKYADAYVKINDAIALDNKNAEAFFIRAEINFAINKYEEALKDYESALKNKTVYPKALSGKILSLNFMGKIKEALELADKAIENDPNNPEYYYCRGIINNERKKFSKAVEDFDKALLLEDPNKSRVYLYRGVAKLNLEEYDEALEDINMAIELDPKSASTYYSRGRVYYEIKEYESAINDFKKSLDFNPKNEVAYYNLGMTYYRLENMEEACKYFHESCAMEYKHACTMVLVESNN